LKELPNAKKTGRPLKFGALLNTEAQAMPADLQAAGSVLNTRFGMLEFKDKGRLVKYGGDIVVTKSFVRSMFDRMGLVNRKGTKQARKL
ncbi:unnamed protein product, partial [Owenia fusiformis]